MPLEAGSHIPELNANNPLGSDAKSEGDDHLRLVKRAVLGSFPGFVGTIATPKSVTLTEDQINDAAQKTADNVFTGANTFDGINTHSAAVILANGVQLQGLDNVAAPQRLIEMGAGGAQVNVGSFNGNLRFDCSARTEFRVGTILVGRTLPLADGGMNVVDQGGNIKKVGFRNPSQVAVSTDRTLTLLDEGRVLTLSSVTQTITVDHLEVGFTCRIMVKANSLLHLLAGTSNIAWRQGDAATATGDFDVGQNSIIELYQSTSSITDLFGNGISGPI